MAKLGFQHEGTMKDGEIKDGQFISLDIYAKLKTAPPLLVLFAIIITTSLPLLRVFTNRGFNLSGWSGEKPRRASF